MTVKGKNMKNKIEIFGFASLLAAVGAPSARAGHVSFRIGASFGFPAAVCSTPVYAPPPVYCAGPAPVVVVAPRVVYAAPVACAAPVAPMAPVYGAPQTVVYARPAYYAPPPPVHVAPASFYIAPPALGISIGFGGGHSHRRHW
jgi:hypothetical protein